MEFPLKVSYSKRKHFPRYWLWCGEFTGPRNNKVPNKPSNAPTLCVARPSSSAAIGFDSLWPGNNIWYNKNIWSALAQVYNGLLPGGKQCRFITKGVLWHSLESSSQEVFMTIIVRRAGLLWLSGVPDYFDRNKISSGGDLSHYSSASLY